MNRRAEGYRRRHHRIGSPGLAVNFGSCRGIIRDWSVGGLSVEVEGDEVLPGENQDIEGELGRPGGSNRHPFLGRVVRTDRQHRLVALEFSRLSDGVITQFAESLRLMAASVA